MGTKNCTREDVDCDGLVGAEFCVGVVLVGAEFRAVLVLVLGIFLWG